MQLCLMLHSNTAYDVQTWNRLQWRPFIAKCSERWGENTQPGPVTVTWIQYISAVCVHIDFPLRPFSEPGCRPSEGLKAWQACLNRVVVSLLDSFLVKQTLSIKVSNLYSKKARQYRSGILTRHHTVRIGVCSSVVVKTLSFWCSVWCKIFSSVRLAVSRDTLRGGVQLYQKVELCS